MDGYIKNTKKTIRVYRETIFCKYLFTLGIVLFIFAWLLFFVCEKPPEKWKSTEIVFSHITVERLNLNHRPSNVLNSQDGEKFVISSRYISVDDLVPGKVYSLVYTTTIWGLHYTKALSDEDTVLQDLNDSILRWESEQREIVIAIFVTLGIEIVALILIDRLWCKKEHAQIRLLKEKIKQRQERMRDKYPSPK